MSSEHKLVKVTLTYEQLYKIYGNGKHEVPCNVSDEIFVKTPSGNLTKIKSVVCKHDNPVIRLDFHDGDSFECSENHTFSVNGEQVKAKDCTQLDYVDTKTNKVSQKQVVEKTELGMETVYDISIDNPHWYIAKESSGIIHHNTFFALSMVNTFLQTYKDGQVLYWDTESAITKEMMESRGIDTKRVVVIGIKTLEEFREQTMKIINHIEKLPKEERKPMIFVLDSLGMLSSEKEIEDVLEGTGKADMTKARIVKSIFRVLTLSLGQLDIPMIVTGHTYKTQSLYAQDVLAGGSGLQYAASSIVFLSKSKEKTSDNTIIGANILCTLKKGRFTREGRRVRVLLNFDTGINKYYGLLDVASKYGVVNRVANKYVFPDGKTAFENAIYKEPEKYFTPEVLKKIDEACAREFLYGGDAIPDSSDDEDGVETQTEKTEE